MSRLSTPRELTDFIVAGDPTLDHAWFWEQLNIDPQTMAEMCVVIGNHYNVRPEHLSTFMMVGARLALRLNDNELDTSHL